MGTSKERDGIFGKYTEHFDDSGKKIGESRERTGIFGNYTEHTNPSGRKTGESRDRTGIFKDYSEHTDSSGRKTGESRERTGLLGITRNIQILQEGKSVSPASEQESLVNTLVTQEKVSELNGIVKQLIKSSQEKVLQVMVADILQLNTMATW
jgi:hypothetical protein